MTELEPLNPPAEQELVAVSLDEVREWERTLRMSRIKRREYKEREDEAKEILRQFFEDSDAEFGSINGRITLRYRRMTVNKFDVAAFRAAHPDLAAEFTRPREETRMEVVEDG